MGGTEHLRRPVSVCLRRPSGTKPLIHRSRPEREGGRPQPWAPASGRRVQSEPIVSPISNSQVIPSASPARKVALRCRAGGRVLRVGRALIRRHSREAPLGSQAVKPSIWELARRAARRGACVARMAHQAARAPMHEIECVERLTLDSLMRELLSS